MMWMLIKIIHGHGINCKNVHKIFIIIIQVYKPHNKQLSYIVDNILNTIDNEIIVIIYKPIKILWYEL